MIDLVEESLTPLSLSFSDGKGEALATGSYLELGATIYLVTNDHVFHEATGGHLGHLPKGRGEFVGVPSAIALPWPVELALAPVDAHGPNAPRDALLPEFLDTSYGPAQGELLFFVGYPGSKALRREGLTEANRHQSWFGELRIPGIPMVTQAVEGTYQDGSENFDPTYHVAIQFPEKAQRADTLLEEPLPNPKGMSGSLLWDTKFVAAAKVGRPWDPDFARVCGIVWGAREKPDVLFATKVEHIRSALVGILQHETAYFHWLKRGRPLGDDLTDWVRAQAEVPDLPVRHVVPSVHTKSG